ncbi:MAG TPA: hypothetical protein ENI64_01975 [Gammaproteobacteria bacterium]|nr:hypothetical protein [Gammaproteobacteria bacterium]
MTTDFQDVPRIAMQVTRGIIVASIQTDLTVPVLARFQNELLAFIHRIGACGVVFDLSGIDILDSVEFHGLRKVLDIASMLGARPVISGLNPGIVSSLVVMNADIDGLEATLQTEDAIALIRESQEEHIVIETDAEENKHDQEKESQNFTHETMTDQNK